MDSETAIELSGVGKRFRLRAGGGRTLKASVLDAVRYGRRRGVRDFWALKDVNFRVAKGETLGIIGANGAGKSTMLSLIAGTMAPTEGRIRTEGVISSLLELGAGFHPDLTGRENVFLYGSIMGLSQRQMRARFDAIVEFAGLSEFIDQPVKRYSSGMYVRLGFAVAVEVEPDILLIDEVLAVGDESFRRRCMDRMTAFRQSHKTMLVISHDLVTIQKVSDRILLLDKGGIVDMGRPESIVKQYESMAGERLAEGIRREWGTGEVTVREVTIRNEAGADTARFVSGEPMEMEIEYEAHERIEKPVFGFAISDEDGRVVYGSNTQVEQFAIPAIEGKGSVVLRLNEPRLNRGSYLFSFSVHSWDHKQNYHRLDNYFPVRIDFEKDIDGCCCFGCSWRKGGTGE